MPIGALRWNRAMSSSPVTPPTAAPLVLSGELTVLNAVELRQRMLDALSAPLQVDLSGVTHVDGAGLQLLIMLGREAAARGLTVSMHSPSRAMRSALDLVRLTDALVTSSGRAA